ncbi:MAG: peroxiredoxin-like family protein [Steroidobacteraceae bacterium]
MRIYLRLFAILSLALATNARADLSTDPAQVRPLAVGTPAPAFAGTSTDGKVRTFSPGAYQRPTILIFYRGGWCPYCNMQLSDLRLAEPKLRARGFEIVFLSTDRPEILYSSLKANDIHYTLLSDSHLEAAKAFHIAYRLDDATLAMQKEYGVDLDKTTGADLHELPVPSVFIIDTSGTIRYVYSNPDYKIRLGSEALLAAAKPYATAKDQ